MFFILLFFFTGQTNIIYRDSYFSVKHLDWLIDWLQTCRFSLHKLLIDGLRSYGLLGNNCDVFISCLNSHFDGTHSLPRIHCKWCDAKILQIGQRSKLIHIVDGLRVSTFLGELFLELILRLGFQAPKKDKKYSDHNQVIWVTQYFKLNAINMQLCRIKSKSKVLLT